MRPPPIHPAPFRSVAHRRCWHHRLRRTVWGRLMPSHKWQAWWQNEARPRLSAGGLIFGLTNRPGASTSSDLLSLAPSVDIRPQSGMPLRASRFATKTGEWGRLPYERTPTVFFAPIAGEIPLVPYIPVVQTLRIYYTSPRKGTVTRGNTWQCFPLMRSLAERMAREPR